MVLLKSLVKDYVVPEGVPTPHYDNLTRISMLSHGLNVPKYEALI